MTKVRQRNVNKFRILLILIRNLKCRGYLKQVGKRREKKFMSYEISRSSFKEI